MSTTLRGTIPLEASLQTTSRFRLLMIDSLITIILVYLHLYMHQRLTFLKSLDTHTYDSQRFNIANFQQEAFACDSDHEDKLEDYGSIHQRTFAHDSPGRLYPCASNEMVFNEWDSGNAELNTWRPHDEGPRRTNLVSRRCNSKLHHSSL